MCQPVEQRAGQAFGTERLGPLVERQVAGDQRRAAFIALRDQLEQQLGTGLAERHEAQFVDDQQLVVGHALLQAQQAPLIAGFHQRMHQCRRGGEADREALLTGGQAQRDVGLAGAAWPPGSVRAR